MFMEVWAKAALARDLYTRVAPQVEVNVCAGLCKIGWWM